MSDQEPEFFYRDLDATLKAILVDMSNWGFIYLGRTGAGLTYSFRRATMKMGTIKAIEQEAAKYMGENALRILKVIAIEGPRWVPYKRIEDAMYNVQPFAKPSVATTNNKKNKPPEPTEGTRTAMTTTKNSNKKKKESINNKRVKAPS